MVDSLNEMPFFKMLKNLSYFATTGYYPIGKVEIGNAFTFISFNPVEKFRTGLALRTSNNFSKRIELGVRLAYGFNDDRFKYGTSIRYNITPKKRGMLTTYYNYDIEQIGISASAASIGSTFGTVFRTGPLDKLTFVKKAGINLEKDVKKALNTLHERFFEDNTKQLNLFVMGFGNVGEKFIEVKLDGIWELIKS